MYKNLFALLRLCQTWKSRTMLNLSIFYWSNYYSIFKDLKIRYRKMNLSLKCCFAIDLSIGFMLLMLSGLIKLFVSFMNIIIQFFHFVNIALIYSTAIIDIPEKKNAFNFVNSIYCFTILYEILLSYASSNSVRLISSF